MIKEKKVIIEAYVSAGGHGCISQDEYETDYTRPQWEELTEDQKDKVIADVLECHLGNNMDCGAWVKEGE